MRLRQRLRASEVGFELRPLLGRDSRREECGVDAEPLCEPGDRVVRRARLPALDLADVLLGETPAGEICLGQPRGDAQGPHAVTEAGASGRGVGGRLAHASRSQAVMSAGRAPPAGGCRIDCEVKWTIAEIT